MSVLTTKRLFLCVVAVLLIGSSAFASHPSPRVYPRMAYDVKNNVVVMFGGRGREDRATSIMHASNETWLFSGGTWAQRFPRTIPPSRSVHVMDSDDDGLVYMFGGRQENTEVDADPIFLSDLWRWNNENWTRLDETSVERPSARQYAAMAYDEDRDVLVLYGGQIIAHDNRGELSFDSVFDTWEFSATNGQWTRHRTDTPKVVKPTMTYDATTKQIFMMGVTSDTSATPLMYRYDGAAHDWVQITPAKFPTCINEGVLLRQNNGRLLFLGGVCRSNTPTLDEAFEFDGTTWTKLTTSAALRGIGQATIWDTNRDRAVIFGGALLREPASYTSFTNTFDNLRFRSVTESTFRPYGRSLMIFQADPIRDRIWMLGGLSEGAGGFYYSDFWSWRQNGWLGVSNDAGVPFECVSPMSAFDTDRGKMVVVCNGTQTHEFDGTTWKEFTELDPAPNPRRFAGLVYDQKLKKTILFGGYSNDNYRNDTWTWDGTKWAELDLSNDRRPPHRGSMSMWYDPLAQKTILYSGIGRANLNQKVTRYSDMWAFDGTRWTNLNITQTPGIRFGALTAVDPVSGKLMMFGGLRADDLGNGAFRQYFENDFWEWDGSTLKWREVEQPDYRPSVRQNGGLAYDPVTGELVLFGGYANGFYLSDVWTWNGSVWTPQLEAARSRRRSVR